LKLKINTGEIWDRRWEGIDVKAFKDQSFINDKWTLFHKSLIEKYLKKLDKDAVFMEAGCGPGQWCFHVSEKFKIKSIGVDVAEKTIEKLNEHNCRKGHVSFVADDLNNSQLKSNLCDMFVSLGVIEHTRDSKPMMRTLHRLTRPNGIGVITVPNLYSIHTFTRPVLSFLGKWDIGYEKSFSSRSLRRLAMGAGFDLIEEGILPTGELLGTFLIKRGGIGRLIERFCYFIERRQRLFGFITYIVVRKRNS